MIASFMSSNNLYLHLYLHLIFPILWMRGSKQAEISSFIFDFNAHTLLYSTRLCRLTMLRPPSKPKVSLASLSTRISLRWLPDPPFENTDTIVMSLQGWYLDLRVDIQSKTIDWAIAGKRTVESEIPC